MDVNAEIRQFIRTNYLFDQPDVEFDDETNLFDSLIIDSLGVDDLVYFVRQRFALLVPEEDITENHFDSVADLSEYVRSMLQNAS